MVKWTRRVYGRWTLGDPGDGGQFLLSRHGLRRGDGLSFVFSSLFFLLFFFF